MLRANGASLCRRSEGTCAGQPPVWINGKLMVFGKCIVPAGGNDNGTLMELRTCTDDPRARWVALSDGTLRNVASGRCLDLPAPEAGVQFHLWDCHGGANQRFSQAEPGRNMKVDDGGFCIDAWLGSSEEGTPLVGWECHDGANQRVSYEQ